MKQISQQVKLKLNNEQKTYFAKAFGCARFAYNWGVEQFNKHYQNHILKNGYELKKEFNSLKKTNFPFVYEVTKYATQQPFIHLNFAIKTILVNHKKGVKSNLSYKKKSNNESLYVGGDQIRIIKKDNSNKDYIKIPLLKTPIKLLENLRFKERIVSVTFKKLNNDFFASIVFETTGDFSNYKINKKDNSGKRVGIDLGISSALTLSSGIKIFLPESLKIENKRLIKLNRQLAKKIHPRTKGDETKKSKNFIKLAQKINKKYQRIKNIRKDFIEKVSLFITTNFQFICMETLDIKKMYSKHEIAKHLCNVPLFALKRRIKDKTEFYKNQLVEVNQFYPSSKLCSVCGTKKDKLLLNERTFKCDKCHNSIDRDLNAALNLLNYLNKQIGGVTAKFTLADLAALKVDLKKLFLTSKVETRNQLNFY